MQCILLFQANLAVAVYKLGTRITNLLFVLNAVAAALVDMADLKVLVFQEIPGGS